MIEMTVLAMLAILPKMTLLAILPETTVLALLLGTGSTGRNDRM